MTKRKHQLHRENCTNVLREVMTDMLNRTIILTGKYGFEWSITICDGTSITKITYSCRSQARKEFNKYKNIRHS